MNINVFADKFEIKKALRVMADTRFDNYQFANSAEQATQYIKNVLNSHFLTDYLFLSYFFTESTLSGTATSGSGSNSLEDTSKSWTASQFLKANAGFRVECLVWDTDNNFYIADVTANTTDTLTLSSIDGADFTVSTGDNYYLRRKQADLTRMAVNIGLYEWFNENRLARGVQALSEICQGVKDDADTRLAEYMRGIRDFEFISKSESVTLNGSELQYLTYKYLVPDTVTVTQSGTTYKPEQGYRINHEDGTIRSEYSQYSTYLNTNATITVAYQFSLRKRGAFGYGGVPESTKAVQRRFYDDRV